MVAPKDETDAPDKAADEPDDGAPEDERPAADRGEQRASPRHAVQLRVDYKRMNTFFADYAKNISKGGTFIRTSKPLDVGTEFVFVLSIPEQVDHLELHGEVVWIVEPDRSTSERPAGMGIRFKFQDDAERQVLEGFVEKLMADKLGSHVAAKLLGKA